MSYIAGDSGHMQAHADLVIAVNVELARFGLPDDLPIKNTGDEGHLDDHNAIVAALSNIESTAGKTFTTALPPTRNLGDPGHPADHSALDACVAEAATWPAWNAATGGTITEIDNYNGTGEKWRVHTFTGTGTLDISLAVQPFRMLAVGGGGGGGGGNGGQQGEKAGGAGGGGEVLHNDALTLTAGAHTITAIGSGGGAGAGNGNGAGSSGGDGSGTTFTTVGTARHGWRGEGAPHQQFGGGGSSGNGNVGDPTNGNRRGGGTNGPGSAMPNGHDSDISGAVVTYGQGGNGSGKPPAASPPNTGQGGMGGGSYVAGEAGAAGIVIVSYRIG